eukprot:6447182-Alexandrium_andersonii.AAC.1
MERSRHEGSRRRRRPRAPRRERRSRLLWTYTERCGEYLVWSRMDERTPCFMLPAPEAPAWTRVIARETIDAETGELVDYQDVCK